MTDCKPIVALAVFALGTAGLPGCGARVDVKSEKQDLGQAPVAPAGTDGEDVGPAAFSANTSNSPPMDPAVLMATVSSLPVVSMPTASGAPVGPASTPGSPPMAAPPDSNDALQSTSVPQQDWIDLEALASTEADAGVELLSGFEDAGPGFIPGDLTLLVIFDNSGSMAEPWNGETRWVVANRTLIEELWPVRDVITVGAIRFPLETQCGVPGLESSSQFGFTSGTEFIDAWTGGAYAPVGATPLAQAFVVADDVIRSAGSVTGLDRGRRFRVMVLTDGEPNCEGDAQLLEQLPKSWYELGIDTHVIGLPGSQPAAELLNRIAIAGGTEQHLTAGDAEELAHEVRALAR